MELCQLFVKSRRHLKIFLKDTLQMIFLMSDLRIMFTLNKFNFMVCVVATVKSTSSQLVSGQILDDSIWSKKCIMDRWIPTPLHYFTLILGLNGAEASLPINSIIVYLIYSTQLGKGSFRDRIWIFSMVGSGFSTFKREYCNLLLLTVILINYLSFCSVHNLTWFDIIIFYFCFA